MLNKILKFFLSALVWFGFDSELHLNESLTFSNSASMHLVRRVVLLIYAALFAISGEYFFQAFESKSPIAIYLRPGEREKTPIFKR